MVDRTHLQCRRDSYLSSSVSTVFPLSLCVSSSLQQPTTKIVLGHLHASHSGEATTWLVIRASRSVNRGTLFPVIDCLYFCGQMQLSGFVATHSFFACSSAFA